MAYKGLLFIVVVVGCRRIVKFYRGVYELLI